MNEFVPLWQDGPLFAQAEHFRLSTDSVLLADFVNIKGAKKGIDLGCASGIISLLLLSRSERLSMSGVELLPEAVALAEKNMEINGLSERSCFINGDIRAHRELFRAGSFDLVTANPPYFPVGSGFVSPGSGRASARSEENCSLEDVCAAAAFLCRTGGSFCMVHKPERLSEVLCCMTKHGLEPKRLRLVAHRRESAANLILVEGRRGGKPGLVIEPLLVLTEPDGSDSEEVKRIYRR